MRAKELARVAMTALMLCCISNAASSQQLPTRTWVAVNGPTGTALHSIAGLAIDPVSPSTVYACASDSAGGIFKTTDSGASWVQLALPVGLFCSGGITIDPLQPNVVYAGSMCYGAFCNWGVLKSTDGGATWNNVLPRLVRWIAITPDSTVVYVVQRSVGPQGLQKSTDGGSFWSASLPLPTTAPLAFLLDPQSATTLYVGAASGVYKTTNSGESWTGPYGNANGLTNTYVRTLLANGRALYAGTNGGVFVSTNGGESWALAGTGTTGRVVNSLAIDPGTPSTMYAGASDGILVTTDSGQSWNPLASWNGAASIVLVEPSASHGVYSVSYGISRSVDTGASWETRNNGLEKREVWSLAFEQSDPTRLFAGLSPGVFALDLPSATWQETGPRSGKVWTFALAKPDLMYAGVFCNGVYRTIDGGVTWTQQINGMTVQCVEGLVTDPTSPTTVYASTNDGLFKSIDGGDSWTSINNGTQPTSGTRRDFQALAIDPVTPTILYAGGTTPDNAVYRTTDAGGTWILTGKLPSPETGLQYLWKVVVDPLNPSTVYATADAVYKTTDSGANWSMAGLAGRSVRDLLVDPRRSNVLYAAVQEENTVYRSVDGGTSWGPYGVGLPLAGVFSLTLDPGANTLYAGTAGQGVYYLSKFGTTTTVSPSANTVTEGQPVVLTASVSSTASTPTGTVRFTDGGSSITGCGSMPLNALGQAACTTILPVGTHSLSVMYLGDADFATGESAAVTVIVRYPDRDGDGIPDASDLCPDVPGDAAHNGCAPPPSLTSPSSITLKACNLAAISPLAYSATTTAITLEQLRAAGGDASAACGISSITYQDRAAGSCPNLVVTRTFAVADRCGQSTSSEQVIRLARAPVPQADLAVMELSYSADAWPGVSYAPPAFWEVYPKARIANLGTVAVSNVAVRFNLPTTTLVMVATLAPGSSVWVYPPRMGSILFPGTYTLTVTIDPGDRVPETNESNNVKSRTIILPD